MSASLDPTVDRTDGMDKAGPVTNVETRRGYRQNLASLSAAQKSGVNAPAYTRFVNRWAGRRLAALAGALGLTPNQVTVLSGIVSWVGILTIALVAPTPVTSALAVLALLLGYALDSADGQLARLTGGGSVLGEWLDHVLDAVKVPGLHLAVLVALFRFVAPVDGALLLLPLLFALVASVYFFTFILTDQLRRAHGDLRTSRPSAGSQNGMLRSLVLLPTDFGVLCLSLALLPWIGPFRIVYGALLVLTVVFLLAAVRKWRREMAVLSAHRAEGGSS